MTDKYEEPIVAKDCAHDRHNCIRARRRVQAWNKASVKCRPALQKELHILTTRAEIHPPSLEWYLWWYGRRCDGYRPQISEFAQQNDTPFTFNIGMMPYFQRASNVKDTDRQYNIENHSEKNSDTANIALVNHRSKTRAKVNVARSRCWLRRENVWKTANWARQQRLAQGWQYDYSNSPPTPW